MSQTGHISDMISNLISAANLNPGKPPPDNSRVPVFANSWHRLAVRATVPLLANLLGERPHLLGMGDMQFTPTRQKTEKAHQRAQASSVEVIADIEKRNLFITQHQSYPNSRSCPGPFSISVGDLTPPSIPVAFWKGPHQSRTPRSLIAPPISGPKAPAAAPSGSKYTWYVVFAPMLEVPRANSDIRAPFAPGTSFNVTCLQRSGNEN
ncbi:hypothetical protein VTK26DRAFT_7378 [Humicola hyalothermophila]